MAAEIFVERDCTFTHEGHAFESGGAVVTPDYAIGYVCMPPEGDRRRNDLRPGDSTRVSTWHGDLLGYARCTARWRTPTSYVNSYAYQVRATINGRHYTGRTAGPGCIWRGRLAACCKRGHRQDSSNG